MDAVTQAYKDVEKPLLSIDITTPLSNMNKSYIENIAFNLTGLHLLNLHQIVARVEHFELIEELMARMENNYDPLRAWTVEMNIENFANWHLNPPKRLHKINLNIDLQNYNEADICDVISNAHCDNIHVVSVVVSFNKSTQSDIVETALSLYSKLSVPIILDPIISINPEDTKNNIALSWIDLESLYNKIVEHLQSLKVYNAIMFKKGIMPLRIPIEHPCNAYMCHGENCHSWKGNRPRHLLIDKHGSIIPISYSINSKFHLGNISEKNICDQFALYDGSAAHQLFLDVAKTVFLKWIQPSPFRVLPWNSLFEMESVELLKGEFYV